MKDIPEVPFGLSKTENLAICHDELKAGLEKENIRLCRIGRDTTQTDTIVVTTDKEVPEDMKTKFTVCVSERDVASVVQWDVQNAAK